MFEQEQQIDKFEKLRDEGITFYEQRNFEMAIERLLRVTDKQPQNWLAKLYLALSYFQRGDQLMARPLLRFLITNCPDREIKARAQMAVDGSGLTPVNLNAWSQPKLGDSPAQNNPAPQQDAAAIQSMVKVLVNTTSGKRHFLSDHKTQIGSDPGNQVVLIKDPFVSKLQAIITKQDNEFWLEDSAAINPTKLNGKPLTGKTKLNAGDAIRLGKTLFRLE
ncbi:MAG TPA: FHA domain-containing protein [Candidatus Obscuribacterales bacterium]